MKKSVLGLIVLLAVSLTACGGGAPSPTATNTPEPAQPTSPPATATPEPTPTEDTTYKRVQEYLGEWSGEWRNTTFGSRGAARATFTAEPDGTATFTIDLDGFVFGALDPDPVTYTGTFSADGAIFEAPGDPLFGDLTITVSSDGKVTILGELVPVEGIASLAATGTITPEVLNLKYTVTFAGSGEAVGEFELTKNS
ncbi:MAG: hypothetical protein GTO14_10435 [Anaerolineales bacterium]|nr:hypothetical protein [Anaerolineales bacterium]